MDKIDQSICNSIIIENIKNNNFSCTKEKEFCVLNKWRTSYTSNIDSFMPYETKMLNHLEIEDIEILIFNRDIKTIHYMGILDNRIPMIELYVLSMIAIEEFSSWFLEKENNNQDLIQQELDHLFMTLIQNQSPVNFVDACMKHLCELSIGDILYSNLNCFLDQSIATGNIDLSRFFAFKISDLEIIESDIDIPLYDYRILYNGDNSEFIFEVIKNKLNHKNEILKFILILIIKILCSSKIINYPFNGGSIFYLEACVLSTFKILHEYEPNILKSILKHLQIIKTIQQSLPESTCKDKINLRTIVCNVIFKAINNNNIYQIEEKLFQIDKIIPFHTMKIIFQKLYSAKLTNINYDEINYNINDFISKIKRLGQLN